MIPLLCIAYLAGTALTFAATAYSPVGVVATLLIGLGCAFVARAHEQP